MSAISRTDAGSVNVSAPSAGRNEREEDVALAFCERRRCDRPHGERLTGNFVGSEHDPRTPDPQLITVAKDHRTVDPSGPDQGAVARPEVADTPLLPDQLEHRMQSRYLGVGLQHDVVRRCPANAHRKQRKRDHAHISGQPDFHVCHPKILPGDLQARISDPQVADGLRMNDVRVGVATDSDPTGRVDPGEVRFEGPGEVRGHATLRTSIVRK